jgi:hypothetical protein
MEGEENHAREMERKTGTRHLRFRSCHKKSCCSPGQQKEKRIIASFKITILTVICLLFKPQKHVSTLDRQMKTNSFVPRAPVGYGLCDDRATWGYAYQTGADEKPINTGRE